MWIVSSACMLAPRTKAFLPYLKQRPEGHIVNISSINGIIPTPFQSPYNAAKYAVRGFTETLIQENQYSKLNLTREVKNENSRDRL